jgi:hypothetical protein
MSDEIVKPKIDKITRYIGCDNSPEYWACCLAHYFNVIFTIMKGRGNTGGEGVIHH